LTQPHVVAHRAVTATPPTKAPTRDAVLPATGLNLPAPRPAMYAAEASTAPSWFGLAPGNGIPPLFPDSATATFAVCHMRQPANRRQPAFCSYFTIIHATPQEGGGNQSEQLVNSGIPEGNEHTRMAARADGPA